MYLEIDLYTPKLNEYTRALKVKNTVLKYFPKKVLDNGDTVFDKLYVWKGYVPDDTGSKELYKLFGTSVDELKSNNWDHVESAWMYFKPFHLESPTLSTYNVNNFIDTNIDTEQEYKVKLLYTQEFMTDQVSSVNISDEEILKMCSSGYTSSTLFNTTVNPFKSGMISFDKEVSACIFIALLDLNNDMFDTSFSILSRTVTETSNRQAKLGRGNYRPNMPNSVTHTVKASVIFKFRIKNTSNNDKFLSNVIDISLTAYNDKFDFGAQCSNLVHKFNPVTDDELLTEYSSSPIFSTSSDSSTYIRYDAAKELKPQDFSSMVLNSLDTDFEQESCHGFKCALGALLMIIVIVVSVVLAAPTGGASLASIPAAAAFFGMLSLYLTVGILALSLTAKWLSNHGEYQIAISFGNSIVVLNKLAQITGILAMVTGVYATIKTLTDKVIQLATERALNTEGITVSNAVVQGQVTAVDAVVKPTIVNYTEAVVELSVDSITSVFSNFSSNPLAAINRITDIVNYGFNIYTKYINPTNNIPAGSTEDSQVLDTSSTFEIEFRQKFNDDYIYAELTDQIDIQIDNMSTPGVIRSTLDRYFKA